MSMSEIEREKNKLLKEILLSERQKKVIKSNKNNITFKYLYYGRNFDRKTRFV